MGDEGFVAGTDSSWLEFRERVTLHVVIVHMYSLWRCCFFLRCTHCYRCLLGGTVGGNHGHIWNRYDRVVLKDP